MTTPITITNEKLQKIKDHVDKKFNVFDEQGNIDLDKCQRSVGYALNIYANYNGILLKERHKLADINNELKLVNATTLHELKMSRNKYDLNAKESNTMLEGAENIRKKQLEYDKQHAYVEFWDNIVKQVGYYNKAVEVILRAAEIKARYET